VTFSVDPSSRLGQRQSEVEKDLPKFEKLDFADLVNDDLKSNIVQWKVEKHDRPSEKANNERKGMANRISISSRKGKMADRE
jgi:hypothetical protein